VSADPADLARYPPSAPFPRQIPRRVRGRAPSRPRDLSEASWSGGGRPAPRPPTPASPSPVPPPQGEFKVRAITRNPDSDAAKALAAAGAEVVKADVLDPASLTDCFKGCHGVFDVTMFWAHLSVEKEEAEVKNVTEAAKAAGVHHFIYSTLADSRTFNLDVPPVEGMPPTYRVRGPVRSLPSGCPARARLRGRAALPPQRLPPAAPPTGRADPRPPTPPPPQVPHFDGKVDFQKKYVEGAFPCLSLVHAAAYWSNLWAFGFLMRNEHTGGKLAYGEDPGPSPRPGPCPRPGPSPPPLL